MLWPKNCKSRVVAYSFVLELLCLFGVWDTFDFISKLRFRWFEWRMNRDKLSLLFIHKNCLMSRNILQVWNFGRVLLGYFNVEHNNDPDIFCPQKQIGILAPHEINCSSTFSEREIVKWWTRGVSLPVATRWHTKLISKIGETRVQSDEQSS